MSSILSFKKIKIDWFHLLFWLVLSLGFVFISLSFPMMKLRFDIWQHIDHIKSYVLDPNATVANRAVWLKTWAFIFRRLGVDDIFSYAVIIHRVQFVLDCIIVYFASKQIFAALIKFDDKELILIRNQWLSSLALSSVFVWLTIIGTYSFFQQAWIMWYSVNYQITLPMLFLSLGLTVNAITVLQSKVLAMSKVMGAFVLVLGIYFLHAGELAYLCLYFLIGTSCFVGKFKFNWKYFVGGATVLGLVLYFLIQIYTDHVPALITLLKNGEYSKILNDIQAKGKWNAIDGGNRYSANWNELYMFSVFAFISVAIYAWISPLKMNARVLCFIGLSLCFCFIPTFQYSAGLASLISYDGIVNRYYFASLIFLITPLLVYLCAKNFKITSHPIAVLGMVFLCLLFVLLYSKKINHEGVYFKNVQSIRNSIKTTKIDIGVSDEFIARVGAKVKASENQFQAGSYIYCGSFESLYIARYIYRKENMLFDRLGNYQVAECEDYAKSFAKKIAYLD